jgi:hypothetical protein
MSLRPFTDDDARDLPPGFLLVLSARSGAGKSTIVQHILSLPSMRVRFASAVVVSPTSMLAGKTPTQFACVPAGLHYRGDQLTEVIEKVIAAQKKARQAGRMGEVLIIADDIFGSVRGQGQNNTRFLDFISTRRHWGGGVAVICIQQHLKCLAPSVRAQVSAFMASRPLTYNDRRCIMEWFLCRKTIDGSKQKTMAEASRILDECYAVSPYAFLFVNAASKEPEVRDTVRVALVPNGGKVKDFRLRFATPKLSGQSNKQDPAINDVSNSVEPASDGEAQDDTPEDTGFELDLGPLTGQR